MSQIINGIMIQGAHLNAQVGSYTILDEERVYIHLSHPGALLKEVSIHASPQTLKSIYHAIGVWLEQQQEDTKDGN
jgi:hypothetical protein